MVVINPIPGQEERNSDHLLEQGAAIRCNNLPALSYKIESLINTPGKLASMSENARKWESPTQRSWLWIAWPPFARGRMVSTSATARHATAHTRDCRRTRRSHSAKLCSTKTVLSARLNNARRHS